MSIDDYRPTFAVEVVYDLKVEDLLEQNIHAILVDLDNTLIAWNNPDGGPELRAWLDKMTSADISVVVVSNNKKSRVERAVSKFGLDFVSRAMKPFSRGIMIAIKRYGFNPEEVIMVGDQLMTDIRASHRVGIRSVLVKPLVTSDAWNTKINRWRERRILEKLEAKYGKIEYKKGI